MIVYAMLMFNAAQDTVLSNDFSASFIDLLVRGKTTGVLSTTQGLLNVALSESSILINHWDTSLSFVKKFMMH